MIVLRIVHILAGVFWVGAFLFTFFLLQPSVAELGPDGGKVMTHLVQRKRMPIVIMIAALLTIVAGVLLYWRVSDGFNPDWITSAPGLTFTVGALAAIAALAVGFTASKPAGNRMGALGQEIATSGGPPSEEQMAEMQSLGQRLKTVGWVNLVLLTIAVVAMAAARYL